MVIKYSQHFDKIDIIYYIQSTRSIQNNVQRFESFGIIQIHSGIHPVEKGISKFDEFIWKNLDEIDD